MKRKPAHTLYSVGFVVNAVFALFLPFVLAGLCTTLSNGAILEQVANGLGQSVKAVSQILNVYTLIVLGVALTQIAGIIVALFERDKIIKSRKTKIETPVAFVIIGLFCQNLFYLIGGIFDFFSPKE